MICRHFWIFLQGLSAVVVPTSNEHLPTCVYHNKLKTSRRKETDVAFEGNIIYRVPKDVLSGDILCSRHQAQPRGFPFKGYSILKTSRGHVVRLDGQFSLESDQWQSK